MFCEDGDLEAAACAVVLHNIIIEIGQFLCKRIWIYVMLTDL
jgi:hypothetical protein